jgi:hypothetical protein
MKKQAMLTLILILSGLATLAQAPAPAAPPAESKAAPTPAPAANPAAPSGAEQVKADPSVPPELTGKTRFEGVVINMQGALAGASYFSVEIERWSTPEEIREAKSALANGGQKLLLDKVWNAKPVGYLKISSSIGKPIRYARAIPVPGGYIVRLLSDTPISHIGMRSQDYPFGFIEMVVPTDNTKGHGQLIGMAQFSFDEKGVIQIAAYGTMPVRLEEVIIKPPKK